MLGYDDAAVVALADRRRDRTRALVGAAPPQMIPSLPPYDRETNERPNTEPTTRDTAVGGGHRLGSAARGLGGAAVGGAATRRCGDSARLGSAAWHGASVPWRLGGVAWRAAARWLGSARRLGAARRGATRRLGGAAARRRGGSARLGDPAALWRGSSAARRGYAAAWRGGAAARRVGSAVRRWDLATFHKREKTHLEISYSEMVAFKYAHCLLLEE